MASLDFCSSLINNEYNFLLFSVIGWDMNSWKCWVDIDKTPEYFPNISRYHTVLKFAASRVWLLYIKTLSNKPDIACFDQSVFFCSASLNITPKEPYTVIFMLSPFPERIFLSFLSDLNRYF